MITIMDYVYPTFILQAGCRLLFSWACHLHTDQLSSSYRMCHHIFHYAMKLLSAVKTTLKSSHALKHNFPLCWISSEPCPLDLSRASASVRRRNINYNPRSSTRAHASVCVCVGPSSDGLSQALHSPDKYNFKDQDINVGVSIIARGFNPCVRASNGCGAQVHKMWACVCTSTRTLASAVEAREAAWCGSGALDSIVC